MCTATSCAACWRATARRCTRRRCGPAASTPYRPFLLATLTKFPTLTAARLHAMVSERGYVGSTSHFRALVAGLRPRPAAEAYLRLRTLPGEQAQVDWAHFGHLQIGRARRPLMAFVMVLSHSPHDLPALLPGCPDGQLPARPRRGLQRLQRLPPGRSCTTTSRARCSSAWAMRSASTPSCWRWPATTASSRARWPSARGNEKGRVERSIRYIRDSFFAGRSFTDLDDLNAQARAWCLGTAADRRWPAGQRLERAPGLRGRAAAACWRCPQAAFALGERVAVTVGKTPYVRFDLNDYSVPHTHVRRTLTVLADEQWVRILDGATELARHRRCWDSHAADRGSRPMCSAWSSTSARHGPTAPATAWRRPRRPARSLLKRAGARGDNLGSITAALMRLLDRYGAAALQAAIPEALARDVAHPNAVRLALERAREASGEPPPVALVLPEHVAQRDAPVRTHDLRLL